jgi:hypothetical protein
MGHCPMPQLPFTLMQKVTQNIKAEYIFESSLRHLSATQPKPCRPHASATRGWLAQANARQTPCLIIKNLLGRIGFAFFICRVCYCIIDSSNATGLMLSVFALFVENSCTMVVCKITSNQVLRTSNQILFVDANRTKKLNIH